MFPASACRKYNKIQFQSYNCWSVTTKANENQAYKAPFQFFAILNEFAAFAYSSTASSNFDEPLKKTENTLMHH